MTELKYLIKKQNDIENIPWLSTEEKGWARACRRGYLYSNCRDLTGRESAYLSVKELGGLVNIYVVFDNPHKYIIGSKQASGDYGFSFSLSHCSTDLKFVQLDLEDKTVAVFVTKNTRQKSLNFSAEISMVERKGLMDRIYDALDGLPLDVVEVIAELLSNVFTYSYIKEIPELIMTWGKEGKGYDFEIKKR